MLNKHIIPDNKIPKYDQENYGNCSLVTYLSQLSSEVSEKLDCDIQLSLWNLIDCFQAINTINIGYPLIDDMNKAIAKMYAYDMILSYPVIKKDTYQKDYISFADKIRIFIFESIKQYNNKPLWYKSVVKIRLDDGDPSTIPVILSPWEDDSSESTTLEKERVRLEKELTLIFDTILNNPNPTTGEDSISLLLKSQYENFFGDKFMYLVRKHPLADILLKTQVENIFYYKDELNSIIDAAQITDCICGSLIRIPANALYGMQYEEQYPGLPYTVCPEPYAYRGNNLTGIADKSRFVNCRAYFKLTNAPIVYVTSKEFLKSINNNIFNIDESSSFAEGIMDLHSSIPLSFSVACNTDQETSDTFEHYIDPDSLERGDCLTNLSGCDGLNISLEKAFFNWLTIDEMKEQIDKDKIIVCNITPVGMFLLSLIDNVNEITKEFLDAKGMSYPPQTNYKLSINDSIFNSLYNKYIEEINLFYGLVFDTESIKLPSLFKQIVVDNINNFSTDHTIDLSLWNKNSTETLKLTAASFSNISDTGHSVTIYGYEDLPNNKIKLYIQNSWLPSNNLLSHRFNLIVDKRIPVLINNKEYAELADSFQKRFRDGESPLRENLLSYLLNVIDGNNNTNLFPDAKIYTNFIFKIKKMLEKISPFILANLNTLTNIKINNSNNTDHCECCSTPYPTPSPSPSTSPTTATVMVWPEL